MPSSDPELERMQSLSEYDFTHEYVIPLFREMGWIEVTYTGGSEEYGRDVTCYKYDNFKYRENVAAVVKIGDIRRTRVVQAVIAEAIAAYQNPYIDPYSHTPQRVSVVYIITSGRITQNSINQINTALSTHPRVHFMTGTRLLEIKNSKLSEYLRYSLIEGKMNDTSLFGLSLDNDFLLKTEGILKYLIDELGASPLHCIDILPQMLIADEDINAKITDEGEFEQKSMLHWFSIYLVTRAWYVYGKRKKFGLLEEVVIDE